MMGTSPLHDTTYFVGKGSFDETTASPQTPFGAMVAMHEHRADARFCEPPSMTSDHSSSMMASSSSAAACPFATAAAMPLTYTTPLSPPATTGVATAASNDDDDDDTLLHAPKRRRSTDMQSNKRQQHQRNSSEPLPSSFARKRSGHRKSNGFTGEEFSRLIISQF